MACCLTALSHYLNQCWLLISVVMWYSYEDKFTGNAPNIFPWPQFENDKLMIIASPRVNELTCINIVLMLNYLFMKSLQWPRNERDGVSNHQRLDCLLSRLFRRRSKKTSKLRVTGLSVGNSPHKGPVTRKMFPFDDVIMYFFPEQRADDQHHEPRHTVLLWIFRPSVVTCDLPDIGIYSVYSIPQGLPHCTQMGRNQQAEHAQNGKDGPQCSTVFHDDIMGGVVTSVTGFRLSTVKLKLLRNMMKNVWT